MNKVSWTHIIADLYECDFDYFINKHTHQYIKEFFEQKVVSSWLTIIWSLIHTFENNSFSIIIMLSESHLCIHTWPEKNYVSMDIFVCNYLKDNTEVSKKLYKDIFIYFSCKKEKLNILKR